MKIHSTLHEHWPRKLRTWQSEFALLCKLKINDKMADYQPVTMEQFSRLASNYRCVLQSVPVAIWVNRFLFANLRTVSTKCVLCSPHNMSPTACRSTLKPGKRAFQYKKDGGALRKVWKEPLRGTKILFCGRVLNFSALRGTNTYITRNLLIFIP